MIKTCFSEIYEANTPVASMRKLRPVAEAIRNKYSEIIDPTPLVTTKEIATKLSRLHCPDYVKSFLTGEGFLAASAFGVWNEKIRDGVLAMHKGQLVGAELALEHGIAANVAQGFHHAGYGGGSAFCTFNGLALVANEHPDKKVFVLDCDQHGGNGTEEFIKLLPNLFQATIHGSTFGCEGIKNRSECFWVQYDFKAYKDALNKAFAFIKDTVKPDLVIYQAGADCHEDDPLGSVGLTTEQMRIRDRMVFEFLSSHNIPTLFVLAGGYQEPIEELLVPLHAGTFAEAYAVMNKRAMSAAQMGADEDYGLFGPTHF